MQHQSNPKHTVSNPFPPENDDWTLIDTQTPTPPESNRERITSHTTEVKYINNRYTTQSPSNLAVLIQKASKIFPLNIANSSLQLKFSTH